MGLKSKSNIPWLFMLSYKHENVSYLGEACSCNVNPKVVYEDFQERMRKFDRI